MFRPLMVNVKFTFVYSHVLSPAQSTFLAAAEELKPLFTSPELSQALARKGVEWKFMLPGLGTSGSAS